MTIELSNTSCAAEFVENKAITHDDYVSNTFATLCEHTFFVKWAQNGIHNAPEGFEKVFTEHFRSYLVFAKFDFRPIYGIRDERVSQFIAGEKFTDFLCNQTLKMMWADAGGEEPDNPKDLTPLAIMFNQSTPIPFKKKYWDEDSFDMVLLFHPEMMPYFERYVATHNKVEDEILLLFNKNFPFRSVKLTRHDPDRENIHDKIERRVAKMDLSDFDALFPESYTFLQEVPSRVHFNTDFYAWQENMPETSEEDHAAIAALIAKREAAEAGSAV
ncbi:hypothetical protein IHQ71_31365 (plasmid) [Rhizobium sp. TH2]|uniref:hypothetical protein n=1 Tax=Rhizobium sp. TH2 TaxID=2775403 RepID=UPI0021586939|nr:hypothetical protein [Rhizobium sp. TH2]UVC12665.1 hypothetical protein IHQ71_31365 [Rhizobium sp. TH2]